MYLSPYMATFFPKSSMSDLPGNLELVLQAEHWTSPVPPTRILMKSGTRVTGSGEPSGGPPSPTSPRLCDSEQRGRHPGGGRGVLPDAWATGGFTTNTCRCRRACVGCCSRHDAGKGRAAARRPRHPAGLQITAHTATAACRREGVGSLRRRRFACVFGATSIYMMSCICCPYKIGRAHV